MLVQRGRPEGMQAFLKKNLMDIFFWREDKGKMSKYTLFFFCLVLLALARAGAVSAFAAAPGPLVRLSPGTLHLLPRARRFAASARRGDQSLAFAPRLPAGIRARLVRRGTQQDAKAKGEGATAADAKPTPWFLLRMRAQAWLNAMQRRCMAWMIGFFPLTGMIRAALRWYAFSASRSELSLAISLMRDAALPVCTGALAVAELREEVLAACSDGGCSLEVKEVLEGSVATVERQLSEALEAALAEFDADGNGIVTVAELLDSLANPSRLASRQRVLPVLEAAQKASDAILQARSFVDETVRLVDEDGDGVITLVEAVRAPKRLFDQWWSSVNK